MSKKTKIMCFMFLIVSVLTIKNVMSKNNSLEHLYAATERKHLFIEKILFSDPQKNVSLQLKSIIKPSKSLYVLGVIETILLSIGLGTLFDVKLSWLTGWGREDALLFVIVVPILTMILHTLNKKFIDNPLKHKNAAPEAMETITPEIIKNLKKILDQNNDEFIIEKLFTQPTKNGYSRIGSIISLETNMIMTMFLAAQ